MRRLMGVGFAAVLGLAVLTGARATTAQDGAAVAATPAAAAPRDWRWVKGTVFVPTNAVNEAQEWDQYDQAVNDRELHYASIYGVNCVRVYLHYYIYLKKKDALLREIEDFLTRADKYGIKTEFVFFDDCWNNPDKDLLNTEYQYPAPIPGVHNSRWLRSPGADVLDREYAANRDNLKAYVQDIVNAHKDDNRIAFWETYNEPNKSPETARLLKDAENWVHATGTPIPLTATGGQFAGDPYSDFKSWHEYGGYNAKGGADDLCTEAMHRSGADGAGQDIPGIVNHWNGKTGYEIWEFGIGRDNCRFAWGENRQHPRPAEAVTPFHGMIYPDGHPWSVDDAKAWMGPDKFAAAPFFKVEYYRDAAFSDLAKTSVSPMMDFDLNDEPGTGSPDASVGVPREHFSERWSASLPVGSEGNYTFDVDSDGLVKLTVDGKVVVEKKEGGRKGVTGKTRFGGSGAHDIVVEYVHDTANGTPSLHVTWSGPGMRNELLTPVGLQLSRDAVGR